MLGARTIGEWTGRPLAQHRDQDVLRWLIIVGEARACLDRLRAKSPRAAATGQARRAGEREVATADASNPASFAALAALKRT